MELQAGRSSGRFLKVQGEEEREGGARVRGAAPEPEKSGVSPPFLRIRWNLKECRKKSLPVPQVYAALFLNIHECALICFFLIGHKKI